MEKYKLKLDFEPQIFIINTISIHVAYSGLLSGLEGYSELSSADMWMDYLIQISRSDAIRSLSNSD